MFKWLIQEADKKPISGEVCYYNVRVLKFLKESSKLVSAIRIITGGKSLSLGCGLSIDKYKNSSRYNNTESYYIKLNGKSIAGAHSDYSCLGDYVVWSISNLELKKEIVGRILFKYDEVVKQQEEEAAKKKRAKDLEESEMLNSLRGCASR